MLPPKYEDDTRSPSTELWHILAVYIMCQYDLDLLSFDLDVMSRNGSCVINHCTKFDWI